MLKIKKYFLILYSYSENTIQLLGSLCAFLFFTNVSMAFLISSFEKLAILAIIITKGVPFLNPVVQFDSTAIR